MKAIPVTAAHAQSPAWPLFICPKHRIELLRVDDAWRCPKGHDFPIIRQIPRFVSGSNYADHFGAQWNRYRKTQLDSHSGTSISETRARRCLGETLWNSLNDKFVLEVGCGAGRFTEILLRRGAYVTSVDLSLAVEANYESFGQSPYHRVAQANATSLPFAPGSFDVVFCLGVVQHTPSPEDTIASLYSQVRPGGSLVFDHYLPTLSTYTKITEPVLRRVLMRLPPATGLKITEGLVDILLPVHRAASRFPLAQQLLSRVSPVRSYYHAYPELDGELQYDWAKLDTHDALTSWYRHARRPAQLEAILRRLRAHNIHTNTAAAFAEIRANRPV